MSHRYNVPMIGLKNWYEEEIKSVGYLASMDDEYLRRMYASKVVSGMNHLTKALDERMENVTQSDKKHELELMRKSVKTAMEHVKADYNVSENNISYKWNANTLEKPMTMNVNESPETLATAASTAAATATPMNSSSKFNMNIETTAERLANNNENLKESNVITLNDLNKYTAARTAPTNKRTATTEGGARRRNKKARKTQRRRRNH